MLMVQLNMQSVEIIPYQESWPGEFVEIASVLRTGLGSPALRIDHIGSTAVPGMAAKDVIDIQITVTRLEKAIINAMSSLDYNLVEAINRDHQPPLFDGTEADWEKLLFRPPLGQRRTHIHVREQGRANQRYPLLFRDYLRAHPAAAQAYAELKRRLAAQLADPGTYPDVKDPAADLIYYAAREWAEYTSWNPGTSDA